jgi:hypothetical protein
MSQCLTKRSHKLYRLSQTALSELLKLLSPHKLHIERDTKLHSFTSLDLMLEAHIKQVLGRSNRLLSFDTTRTV